mmetsp:Transcript_75492/g.190956  ORF Transcript_75492/g.190956 Transcript_75492/m.190956 type:complete len:168 (+) Transcript_75492:1027-1530(+)
MRWGNQSGKAKATSSTALCMAELTAFRQNASGRPLPRTNSEPTSQTRATLSNNGAGLPQLRGRSTMSTSATPVSLDRSCGRGGEEATAVCMECLRPDGSTAAAAAAAGGPAPRRRLRARAPFVVVDGRAPDHGHCDERRQQPALVGGLLGRGWHDGRDHGDDGVAAQ